MSHEDNTQAVESTQTADPAVVEEAKTYLSGVLERMGFAAEIAVSEKDDRVVFDVQCDGVERVIGKRGQVVDALQHLVAKAAHRDRSVRGKPIVVDAGDYRAKSIERLQGLAQRMADKAIESNDTVELSPMSSHDRRIVHMALADVPGVETRSEGSGHNRHVCVVPRNDAPVDDSSVDTTGDVGVE